MNSYTDFAYIYDYLMNRDFDYPKWADYIENLFGEYGKSPESIIDLACGTGNFSIPLAKRGYKVTGVDRSADMLTIAKQKAVSENADITFVCQSMTRLDMHSKADAFLCMIDGINYIAPPKSLLELFSKIKNRFLSKNGIFIFDISSKYKLSHTIGSNTFIYDTDDIFYTWENRYFEKAGICDMLLTFFINENGMYRRFEERHIQKAYTAAQIKHLLKKAGFEKIDIYGEMSFDSPSPESQRIVFAAM